MCFKKSHRCSTPHFVVNIFLTHKSAFLILHPTKRKFLSIIVEQDETTPPVALVLQLSRALRIDVETLGDEENRKASSRIKSQKRRAGSYAYAQLTKSGANKHLGGYLVTIEPNTTHEGVEYHHDGEEFIYVLKGTLSISVGKNTSILEQGEYIHFNSALHHALSNPSSEKTELLVVLYIP